MKLVGNIRARIIKVIIRMMVIMKSKYFCDVAKIIILKMMMKMVVVTIIENQKYNYEINNMIINSENNNDIN